MQELNGASTVDMSLMESMIHNRRFVSSSINGVEKSGEKQEIKGITLGIQVMEADNHIKTDVIKPSKRQAKKRKVQNYHKATLYAKW